MTFNGVLDQIAGKITTVRDKFEWYVYQQVSVKLHGAFTTLQQVLPRLSSQNSARNLSISAGSLLENGIF